MKKLLAILMALALVFCFAACGDKTAEEEPTRSQEELIAEANEAAAKLVEYKETLDKQLLLVNSADNTDGFFDLAGMAAAGAQLDAVIDLINFDSDELTDGDTSPVDSVATAKQAADQIREIAEKSQHRRRKILCTVCSRFPRCGNDKDVLPDRVHERRTQQFLCR